jgi:S-DNA-T family DNA segregation ATPase FtsK/SpoIIIE
LRLGDPTDSFVDRRTAILVPEHAPGRGVTSSKHQFLTGAPRFSNAADERVATGMTALVNDVASAWTGEPAPDIKLLPGEVPFEDLDGTSSQEAGVSIGVAERDLSAVHLDLMTETNFLLLGDTASGKSGFLRTVAKRLTEIYTPEEARLVVIDHRRSLLGGVEGDHLLGYGTNQQVSATLIQEVATAISERLPGPDITPEQLRNRSWWQGPEVFVLVDDYDMVATFQDHAMMPLLSFLAQGSDVGLHVIVARRSGGAGRGLFEPFLARLRDIGTSGLLMSGDRNEGPLLGNLRPQILPPGRGFLVDRRGVYQLIQLTLPPAETPAS